MGLTNSSTGLHVCETDSSGHSTLPARESPDDRIFALAGNPNVGKSTVFNSLTGLKQHTGNWPGKTVATAWGKVSDTSGTTGISGSFFLVDLPGCYSLLAHSAEEEVARDFLCFGQADAVIVVCDATCLERNMNLVLQTIEITSRTVVCVNLLDEAVHMGLDTDLTLLSERLHVPVIGTTARSRKGLSELLQAAQNAGSTSPDEYILTRYDPAIEEAVSLLQPAIAELELPQDRCPLSPRFLALRLLENDTSFLTALERALGFSLSDYASLNDARHEAESFLLSAGIGREQYQDLLVQTLIRQGEEICAGIQTDARKAPRTQTQAKLRILSKFASCRKQSPGEVFDTLSTSRLFGFPLMFLLLALIFWITIKAANYPSSLLAAFLFWLEDRLAEGLAWLHIPAMITDLLVHGMYRVLAWVVSVMLPPMAIFFPMFTLLEDFGYLPRVAFNLDRCFQKCRTCGKQALSMCMGFGCNAAGIVGCRIIDSPRERLIAMITNSFVPCNGRFPALITIITIFFVQGSSAASSGSLLAASSDSLLAASSGSLLAALLLSLFIVLGILVTLLISWLLSRTLLRGIPSSFTLELPPFRRPQIGRVLVRSVLDRTLFVLGRAVVIAAPAGLLIWLLANLHLGDASLLRHCADFLDPFARLFGLDGVILLAFILGLPANEIVLPLVIMAYTAEGSLTELTDLTAIHTLLTENGWTAVTALCFILFSLMHWPCSTTLLTIRRESGGWKWAAVSFLIPTVTGLLLCAAVNLAAGLIGQSSLPYIGQAGF